MGGNDLYGENSEVRSNLLVGKPDQLLAIDRDVSPVVG